jgi:hypothetical protein
MSEPETAACHPEAEAPYNVLEIAYRIATGFLVPACRFRPDAAKRDFHEQWKPVNQAAGVIAGYVSSFDPELVDPRALAQRLVDAAVQELDHEEAKIVARIATGLSTRVAACLVALGIGS